ncbi:MAG: protein TolR [Gammaproteobacteria bacterium]|nr:protein TolR [Gammaproteobacteria bacterium]
MNTNKKRRPMSEINVVPYIDVMLVLLVIFMITAPLLSQGVKVDLPKASAKPLSTKDQKPIIVTIDQYGRYFLNISDSPEKPVTAQPLLTQIQSALNVNQQRTVLVKGDQNANYGKIINAMVLLQQAGVDKVGLMTENPAESKSHK